MALTAAGTVGKIQAGDPVLFGNIRKQIVYGSESQLGQHLFLMAQIGDVVHGREECQARYIVFDCRDQI